MDEIRAGRRTVYATQDGSLVPLEEMPDAVFAEKILGDGVCIIPTSSQVRSPVNGTVSQVADTLHAIGIAAEDGVELLVHIGIDTVRLKGSGFDVRVHTGDKVAVGDILCSVDLEYIRSKGLETHTAIILTEANGNKVEANPVDTAVAGVTPVFTYS